MAKYRERRRDHIRARTRVWCAANKERIRGYHQKYQSSLPPERVAEKNRRVPQENKRAYALVWKAVHKDGRLVKPTSCTRCGGGGRIEAHHTDYSKKLAVEWLCKACHAAEHRFLRATKRPA